MADHSDKIPFFDREGYPLHRRFFIRGTGRIPVGQIVEFQNGHNVLSNLSEEILYQKRRGNRPEGRLQAQGLLASFVLKHRGPEHRIPCRKNITAALAAGPERRRIPPP